MQSRRSCLAVPGSSEKMLAKAQTLDSDMFFLDLEDAVAPSAKVAARTAVVQALVQGTWGDRIACVRINAYGTPWYADDLKTVVEGAGESLDTIMLPKCSSPDQVRWLDATLDELETALGLKSQSIGIELQIEDARGLTYVDAIAAASPRTQALHFGPGDFQASMAMPSVSLGQLNPDYPGDILHHVYGRLLVCARAHDLQVLDGPYLAIKDLDGLSAAAKRVAAMGFDGKWVLHPDQIALVNQVFSPSQEQYDRAELILDAYDFYLSDAGGARGAAMLEGEMIDEASRAMALVVTSRGRAAAMVRTSAFTPPE
ncbi:MAG: CoA ester lyase [Actinobacteria bacterium]|nr:CoA ester lyase [Actinomycetota bacterium]